MRWLPWRRDAPDASDAEPLDLDAVFRAGRRSPDAARQAIARLKREQATLLGQRRAVERSLKRLTSGQVKTIARMNGANPALTEMQTYELSQRLRAAQAAEAESLRGEQLAAIDARLEAVERAIDRLDTVARSPR